MQTVMLKKEEILWQWASGTTLNSHKLLTPKRLLYTDIDEQLWQWFLKVRAKNLPVSGRMLQDQAFLLAEQLGHAGFSASNGWLRSFQQRHGLHLAVLSGEAADVNPEVVPD